MSTFLSRVNISGTFASHKLVAEVKVFSNWQAKKARGGGLNPLTPPAGSTTEEPLPPFVEE